MDFSIENLFKYHGQYDKVVTLSFKPDSYSAKNYGQFLTGIFQYTRDERITLESTISKDGYEYHHGRIKIKELLNDVCDEQREELTRTGIDTTDITEVFSLNITPPKNEFKTVEIKKLPESIILNADLSNREYDALAMGTYKSMNRNGYKLIPFEEREKIAIELRRTVKNIEEIKDEAYVDKETGNLSVDILLEILRSRERNQVLTEVEEDQLHKLEIQDLSQRIIQMRKTLLEYITKKELATEETKSILNHLIPKVVSFHPKRLTHNKIPVWIDLDRYLHIYLRHVKEVQIGNIGRNKSSFNYDFNEIDRLMDTVLNSIQDDIQKHFEEHPDKPFKRHGEMTYYFKGDYYAIHIEPSGRLMTFYKVK